MITLTGPLDPHAIEQGKLAIGLCENLTGADEFIDRLYGHWSVEDYKCVDGAYNFVILLKNGAWIVEHPTSSVLNATIPEGDGYAEHTYYRNGHALGIAVNGMEDATRNNFGPEPIQAHELEVFCAVVAGVAKFYNIDIMGTCKRSPWEGEPNFFTHAEAAFHVGNPPQYTDYFGERWDLERFQPSPEPESRDNATHSGNILRARIHEYKVVL